MKLITRDTDYAVRALCFIAKCRKSRTTASELVVALRIPRPFLRKILQLLNKAGLLKSYRGQGGGFRLVRSPKKIKLADLMKIFQGPVKINDHVFKNSPCPHIKVCKLKKRLDRIDKLLRTELKNITLDALL